MAYIILSRRLLVNMNLSVVMAHGVTAVSIFIFELVKHSNRTMLR